MAYNLNIDVSAFHWKGERTEAMTAFQKVFEYIDCSRTASHVLRAKSSNGTVEVPLGGYLVVPDMNYQNRFSLSQANFVLHAVPIGGIRFRLSLENVQVLFFQDVVNRDVEGVLKEHDPKSRMELAKARYYSCGRFVSIAQNRAMLIGDDYSFTLEADYCRTLSQEQKLQFRNRRVVIDDASVVVIRTDATVIVDAEKQCSIYRKKLTRDDTDPLDGVTGTNQFENIQKGSPYSFHITSNANANAVCLRYLRDHADQIKVNMSATNQKVMLKYILDSLGAMLRQASICPNMQIVTNMRIQSHSFSAIYYYYDGIIALI